MKGDIRLQMFRQKVDLLKLIVKRCVRERYIYAAALILGAQSFAPMADCQPTRTEAVNLRDHIYRGNTCLSRRDYDGALTEYESALEIEPSNTTARDNIVLTHNNWGIDLFRQKKFDEAKVQWETALKLNPYDRNAKNNLAVLKTTLARLGPAAAPSATPAGEENNSGLPGENDTKSGPSIMPKGAQAPKEDNTPAPHAVILNRTGGSQPTVDANAASSTGTTGSGSSGGVVILNSGARAVPPQKDNPYASSSAQSAPPQRDNPYASSSAPPVAPQKNNPYADTPPAPPPAPPPPSSSSASALGAANIDDKLSAIETKVYGHASKDAPLLQRLEHLERDTSSRPSLGSINDRVQTLLRTYGL